jgi:hypothetical protein
MTGCLSAASGTSILATPAVFSIAPPAAACYGWTCEETATAPSRHCIIDTSRRIGGDLYRLSPDRRLQIRDQHRQIIVCIEADGTITNTSRQRVGTVEGLVT